MFHGPGLLLALTIGLAPGVVLAQTPPPAAAGGPACGYAPSDPVLAKWRALDGETGRLGCPTTRESAAPASPAGNASREMTFGDGAILWHASGPRAGQTFAISGCIWRLYFQYGGPGGWLGLPTSDAANTPDGQRQTFEGGYVVYQRAPDACEATHSAETAAATPAAGAAPGKAARDLFFDPARGDYLVAASAPSADRALAAHYRKLRTQALVFDEQGPGTIPLKLYWNEARGAHVVVASADGEREALAAGDTFEGVQGFVWADPHPGAVPLKQFANPATGHNRLTNGAEEETQAKAEGYAFVRVEGYAPAAL